MRKNSRTKNYTKDTKMKRDCKFCQIEIEWNVDERVFYEVDTPEIHTIERCKEQQTKNKEAKKEFTDYTPVKNEW